MPSGKVGRYDADKGYGFIRRESGDDLLFHVSEMLDRDGWVPVAGQGVDFDVARDSLGRMRATGVRRS